MTLNQFMAVNLDDKNYDILLKKFREVYEHLYSLDCGTSLVDYSKAVSLGEALVSMRGDIAVAFAKRRGDLVTSDREVASYAIALTSILGL